MDRKCFNIVGETNLFRSGEIMMRAYIIKHKKNRYFIILMAFILIIFVKAAYGDEPIDIDISKGNSDKINVSPGALQFWVETPHTDLPANHVLRFSRKKANDKNVYYRVIDNSGCPVDISEYILAKTPYYSDYQSLDKPVLFLAREDESSIIYLKLKIDDYLWQHLSDGVYKLELVSDWGKSVKINIHVKKTSYLTVYPDKINIIADNGPGKYQSKDSVTVYISNSNNRWNLDISATPLTYQGSEGDNVPVVEKGDIYVSVDSRNNFINLNNPYRLSGKNYGSTTSIDLYFQAGVGYKHYAGDYRGEIILTISGQ